MEMKGYFHGQRTAQVGRLASIEAEAAAAEAELVGEGT